jgi:ribosome modulation factor
MARKIDTEAAHERGQQERRRNIRNFDKCPFTNPKLKTAWESGWRMTDSLLSPSAPRERVR